MQASLRLDYSSSNWVVLEDKQYFARYLFERDEGKTEQVGARDISVSFEYISLFF
jgi:hypothetical protein